MDKTDLEILKILQKKARIPNVEVSRAIGMAPSMMLSVLKNWEARSSGTMKVRLNPDMFGCAMTAFVSIQVTRASKIRETGELLATIEQVQEVHYLAGGDILMIKVKASGNMELEELIQTRIADVSSVKGQRKHLLRFPLSRKVPRSNCRMTFNLFIKELLPCPYAEFKRLLNGGQDAVSAFGTPFHIYDETGIVQTCRA